MNNIPVFTVGEHILVDNAITTFVIEIHTSNLLKRFKVHYVIEYIYKHNVAKERCRNVSIITESN